MTYHITSNPKIWEIGWKVNEGARSLIEFVYGFEVTWRKVAMRSKLKN